MAFTSTEGFESVGNGSNVAGTSGGSGWSGSWSALGSDGSWVGSTSTVIAGSVSAIHNPATGSDTGIERSFTAITSGVVRIKVRRTSNSSGRLYVSFRESGNERFGFTLANDGKIYGDRSGGQTQVGTYSANTTYAIDVSFDCGTDLFKVRVDLGSYSSDLAFVNTATNIDSMRVVSADAAGGVTNIVDDIGDGTSSPSPSLSPSLSPSKSPSLSPSLSPSASPSLSPSKSPSLSPSLSPSASPSKSPSISPSLSPSLSPSISPSISPSVSPSVSPSMWTNDDTDDTTWNNDTIHAASFSNDTRPSTGWSNPNKSL